MQRGAPPAARILVRLPSWVGDAVLVTPALRALRAAYPGASIVAQGRGHLRGLLHDSGVFDEFLALERGPRAGRANARAARATHADLAFVFPHSFRSAWEIFRAGIRRRYGYAREGRSLLLTDSLPTHRTGRRRFPVPMVLQYLELVAMVGAEPDRLGPQLGISSATRDRARAALERLGVADSDRLIGLNPGASFGPSKIWPVRYVAELADRLQSEWGRRVLLLGGPGEEALLRDVEARMRTVPFNTADSLVPLDELKAVLERCDAVVTTDAGPRHIAVAVGTPTVCLMGPTDPRYTHSHLGPSVVLRRDVPCGPCHLKTCPLDHRCLESITPIEVLEVVRARMRGPR
ncbi:MAG: lipopolysaccharide heptosyltransferase II [Planctomycetota bacterium]